MRKAYKRSGGKLILDVYKITTYFEEREWEGAIWIYVARDEVSPLFFFLTHIATSYAVKGGQFVDQLCDY